MAATGHPYEILEDKVLHLSREDRSKLASRLLESLDDDELSPEWRSELQRRVRDIDEGRTKLITHDEVIAKVKARLEEVRGSK